MKDQILAAALGYAAARPEAHTIHVQALRADGHVLDYTELGRDWGRARPENVVAWALSVPGAEVIRCFTVRPDGRHNEDGPGHETSDYETFSYIPHIRKIPDGDRRRSPPSPRTGSRR